MRSSGLFELSCAVALAGCGQVEHTNPFTIPRAATQQAGSAGTAGASGSAGTDWGGTSGSPVAEPLPLGDELTAVAPSQGCGAPFHAPTTPKQTLDTRGVKAPDCAAHLADDTPVCGPWALTREYYLNLPVAYASNKPYPLILEAPGCGGSGANVYPLSTIAQRAIRVGLTPPPNTVGHGTNPEQHCFDTHEGDDSLDWVFYEKLYDRLNEQLCFDRNRVFAVGYGSGAWLANELGCKYAGDTLRAVRGVIVYNGGLPTEPAYTPSCSVRPLAGVWLHEVIYGSTPFTSARVAIDRAMALAHCPAGQTYPDATFTNFPIGGQLPDDTCQRIDGCDPLYPLVVCPFPDLAKSDRSSAVDAAAASLIRLFVEPPLGSPSP